jgi:outer membrane biosynthesis protein TonB
MARDVASNGWAMRAAVAVSILAHAAVISASGLRRQQPTKADPPPAADQWTGNTSMPVGGELHDVDLAGGQPSPAVPPSPQTTPAPEPAASPPEPVVGPVAKNAKEDKKTTEPVKPIAKADTPKEPRDKPKPVRDTAKAKQDVENDAKDKETGGQDAAHAKRDPQPASPGGAGAGSFGSVGAASVRDLGRAFTRAIPPACDADSVWAKLSPGSAGSIEVAILVGDDGRITGWEPLKPNPPAHLAAVVKRTLPLMRGGTFAINNGAVTSGRQILRLSAEVSDVDVGTDPFELGRGDWDGKKGVAYFTQTSGRHVEIKVELVRVEPG